jgi:hypothetical protein
MAVMVVYGSDIGAVMVTEEHTLRVCEEMVLRYIQGAAREMTCFEISKTVLYFQGK